MLYTVFLGQKMGEMLFFVFNAGKGEGKSELESKQ